MSRKVDRLKERVTGTVRRGYEEYVPPRVKNTLEGVRKRGLRVQENIKARSPRGKQILLQSLQKGVRVANPFSEPPKKKRRGK